VSVTVVILTHARTALLAEAVASAVAAGPDEVLVVNDCPWQDLRCDHPRVRVVPLTESPSIGHARKAALGHVRTDFFQWLDDDDLLLPWCDDRWCFLASTTVAAVWNNPLWWDSKTPDSFYIAPDTGYTCINFAGVTKIAAALPPMRAPEDLFMRGALGGYNLGRRPDYLLRRPWSTKHLSQVQGMSDNPLPYREDARRRRDAGSEPAGAVVIRPTTSPALAAAQAFLEAKDHP
jgi:hypothetical protein